MGHDFSYRGLGGDEAAAMAGCGHLSVFKGSDTIPAIKAMEDIYGEVTGFSVPATEHSVMCAGGEANEFDTYNRILGIYPTGIVSIVSDTWDYFHILTDTLPKLKDKIMARDGKTVIRPDSGDPVDIICGVEVTDFTKVYEDWHEDYLDDILYSIAEELCGMDVWSDYTGDAYFSFRGATYGVEMNRKFDYEGDYVYEPGYAWEIEELTPEQKGSLDILADTFGYTLDSAGLKVLDSHIGLIYGDGMTQETIKRMLTRMVAKGYSPLNLVFGIGAYTYQFMTRDELGFAFKAVAVEIDGEWKSIQKDPKTDPGKKSLTGVQNTSNMERVL
jgi:nicotinamide phosphoribosyltransferase